MIPRRLLPLFLVMHIAPEVHAQEHASYTLLTWNIRYDNPADSLDRWDNRKAALSEEVARHRPAIIGLQEVLVQQVAYLDAEWPRYERFGVGREDGKEKGEFSPVYFDTTVFQLVDGRTHWLSPTPDVPGKGWDAACERIATLVILRDKRTGDSLWLINTHWDHVGVNARNFSAFMMKGLMNEPLSRGKPVIVMGDLNAEPGSQAIDIMAQWFVDSCPDERKSEATFNGFKLDGSQLKRIDYVWLGGVPWKVSGYDVPEPLVNARQVSDHFPVVVGIVLR